MLTIKQKTCGTNTKRGSMRREVARRQGKDNIRNRSVNTASLPSYPNLSATGSNAELCIPLPPVFTCLTVPPISLPISLFPLPNCPLTSPFMNCELQRSSILAGCLYLPTKLLLLCQISYSLSNMSTHQGQIAPGQAVYHCQQ